jgi:hypothetical protein
MTAGSRGGELPSLAAELGAFAAGLRASAPASAGLLARLAEAVRLDPAVQAALLAPPPGGPLLGIRALAAVHELMLRGQAPKLRALVDAAADPSEPEPSSSAIWAAARDVLLDHAELVRHRLRQPAQQSLPDPAGQLLRALAMVGAGRIRLLELGAGAGLSLGIDRYRWVSMDWAWGPADSPVRLPNCGPAPARLSVVERGGCDLAPLDPADPEHVLRLHSLLPPEHGEARRRLDAALALLARDPVPIDAADAASWLDERLRRPPAGADLTVVWHSLLWPLLPDTDRRAIRATITAAARRSPLLHIGYESEAFGEAPTLRIEAPDP